jgi:hypothetical protein
MPKGKPGDPEEEFDDKASERLRQFEESRLPEKTDHKADSPPASSEACESVESPQPLPSQQKGESSDERSDG